MIVVTAATGQLGRRVLDRLLERVPAAELVAVVRNPGQAADLSGRGVDVRRADYDDPESMTAAFRGADRLLFVSSPISDGGGGRVVQHRRVVDAAARAGVGHLLYTSGLGADMVSDGVLGEHQQTEHAIADSGLPHTFLRNPIYSDFFLGPNLRAAVESGELTSNTHGRGMNTASRDDLAEATAALLAADETPRPAYNFTGLRWTYPELAEVLSEVSGRPVSYREEPDEEGGLSALGLAAVIQAGGFEVQTPDLAAALGHSPTTLRAAVVAALGARGVG